METRFDAHFKLKQKRHAGSTQSSRFIMNEPYQPDKTEESQKALEIAFEHAKNGRRVEAIAFYRKVVELDPDNREYAQNCIDDLSELERVAGESEESIESRINAVTLQESFKHANPYSSPGMSLNPQEAQKQQEHADFAGNLKLAATIIKAAAVTFLLMMLWNSIRAYAQGARFLAFNFSWFDILMMFQLLFIPLYLLLFWLGWRYSNSMNHFAEGRTEELHQFAKRQAYFWLGITLWIAFIIADAGLMYASLIL